MFGSADMTGHDFRLEVASRLAPFLRAEDGGSQPVQDLGTGEPSVEAAEKQQPLIGADPFGSPASFSFYDSFLSRTTESQPTAVCHLYRG